MNSNFLLDEQILDFLHFVRAEKGLAINTLSAYEKDLDQFRTFLIIHKFDFTKLTFQDLRKFVAWLRSLELMERSIARKVSTLKHFYKFLLRDELLESDPSEQLQVRVTTKKLPKHLTHTDVAKLLASAIGDTPDSIRDRAMLELWYATGVRASEMAQLRAGRIDFTDGMVKVIGKGDRERWVPIHPEALKWCEQYRKIRHEWLSKVDQKNSEYFFLTPRGSKFSRQMVWKIIKQYAKKAGLSKNVWPHMIRHTFATHVLNGGADLRVVQELLGHRSIGTTQVYTHLDIKNLKTMHKKYHPRG